MSKMKTAEEDKYDEEMESIYMAAMVGANYPTERLAEAILYLKSRQEEEK